MNNRSAILKGLAVAGLKKI